MRLGSVIPLRASSFTSPPKRISYSTLYELRKSAHALEVIKIYFHGSLLRWH